MLRHLVSAMAAWVCLAVGAAADLPAPSGPVLLTIVTPDGETLRLDRDALQSLPETGFTTTTIWTDGPQEFRGVRFTDLLAEIGVGEVGLTLVAANGYRVERDTEELQAEDALLAYQRNGAPMSLRDKGPLWLVYDYDSDPSYRTEVIYANSIWQLDRIEIGQ